MEGVGLLAYSPLAMGLLTVRPSLLQQTGVMRQAVFAPSTLTPIDPVCSRTAAAAAAADATAFTRRFCLLHFFFAQGKYLAPDGGPPGARLNRYKGRYAEAESRYGPRPRVIEAVRRYVELAASSGMSPTELAIRSAAARSHCILLPEANIHTGMQNKAVKLLEQTVT